MSAALDARTACDPRRRRLRLLLQCVADTLDEMVDAGHFDPVGVAIDGVLPAADNVALVRDAIHRLPRVLRRVILQGARVEVIPGTDARLHPQYRGPWPNLAGAVIGHRLAVVAADCASPGITALHECAHLLDRSRGLNGISGSIGFRVLWLKELKMGFVPAENYQREMASEFFAGEFSRYFFSPQTRAQVRTPVQNFMSGLVQWFQ